MKRIEMLKCDSCKEKEAEFWSLGGNKLCKKCADELGLVYSERNSIKNFPTYVESKRK